MSRRLALWLVVVGLLLVGTVPAYAQAEATGTVPAEKGQWLLISAAFGMALAAAACGYAQSRALTAACEGVSRNPGATDTIRIFIFLGLAFIEFLALLTFVVIILLIYG